MTTSTSTNIRWFAKKILPKKFVDGLRTVLPESIYYPGYGHTTLNEKKINNITKLVKNVLDDKIEGNAIECGVFRGGSLTQIGNTLKKFNSNKKLFGVDTFEGHPFHNEEDVPEDGKIIHHKGLFSGNQLENVQKILDEKNLDNTKLFKGLVSDVLPNFLKNENFCFVHLDLDLYISTKQALEFLYPRMMYGGIIVFDDYDAYESPGVKKAAEEILGIDSVRKLIDSKDGNQGFWKKMD